MFDVLIIGGGVAGVSCALILGSAKNKVFMQNRNIGIIAHQKTSSLQEALFNNAYGISAGKWGSEILSESLEQLSNLYPNILQIHAEKVMRVEGDFPEFEVFTNKNSYKTRNIVVAVGYSSTFNIDGLNQFVQTHQKSAPEKQRIELKNIDHKIVDGIYVAGTLAGWRSQLAIAAGSGAAVATDLLTFWNNGLQSQCHDKR